MTPLRHATPDRTLVAVVGNCCQPRQDRAMSSTPTMNIALTEAMRAYVAERVASGEFGNTSEDIRDLIRKDQQEQRTLRLRALVEEGLASGPAVADSQADRDELMAIALGKLP